MVIFVASKLVVARGESFTFTLQPETKFVPLISSEGTEAPCANVDGLIAEMLGRVVLACNLPVRESAD